MAPNKEMIDAFVDGRLSATDHELMVHHISSCTECAAAVIAALAEAARALAAESSERHVANGPAGIRADETSAEDLLQLDLILDRTPADAALLIKPDPIPEIRIEELPVSRVVEAAADVRPPPPPPPPPPAPAEVINPVQEEVTELDEREIAGMTAAGIVQSVASAVAALAADQPPELHSDGSSAAAAESTTVATGSAVDAEVGTADGAEGVAPVDLAAESVAPVDVAAESIAPIEVTADSYAAVEQPGEIAERATVVEQDGPDESVSAAPLSAEVETSAQEVLDVEPVELEREVDSAVMIEPEVAPPQVHAVAEPDEAVAPGAAAAAEPGAAEGPETIAGDRAPDGEQDTAEAAAPLIPTQSEEEAGVVLASSPIAVVEEGDGGFRVTGVADLSSAATIENAAMAEPAPRAATRAETIPEDERAALREMARHAADDELPPRRRWPFAMTATVALLMFAALASYAAVQLRGYASMSDGPPPVPVPPDQPPPAVSVLAPVLDSAVFGGVIDVAAADSPAIGDSLLAEAGGGTLPDTGGTPVAARSVGAPAVAARPRPSVTRAPAPNRAVRELPRVLRTTTHRPRPEVDYVLREYDATGPAPDPRPGVSEYRWLDADGARLYVLSGRATVEELRAYARRFRNGTSR